MHSVSMSAAPISSASASMFGYCVQNPFMPASTGRPSLVLHPALTPPGAAAASKSSTCAPARAKARAAPNPAQPAPITTAFGRARPSCDASTSSLCAHVRDQLFLPTFASSFPRRRPLGTSFAMHRDVARTAISPRVRRVGSVGCVVVCLGGSHVVHSIVVSRDVDVHAARVDDVHRLVRVRRGGIPRDTRRTWIRPRGGRGWTRRARCVAWMHEASSTSCKRTHVDETLDARACVGRRIRNARPFSAVEQDGRMPGARTTRRHVRVDEDPSGFLPRARPRNARKPRLGVAARNPKGRRARGAIHRTWCRGTVGMDRWLQRMPSTSHGNQVVGIAPCPKSLDQLDQVGSQPHASHDPGWRSSSSPSLSRSPLPTPDPRLCPLGSKTTRP